MSNQYDEDDNSSLYGDVPVTRKEFEKVRDDVDDIKEFFNRLIFLLEEFTNDNGEFGREH